VGDHHVAEGADGVVEADALADAERLGDVDLDVAPLVRPVSSRPRTIGPKATGGTAKKNSRRAPPRSASASPTARVSG
jgi:hypothetical protein